MDTFKYGDKVVVYITVNDEKKHIFGIVQGWGQGLDNKEKLKVRIMDNYLYFKPEDVVLYTRWYPEQKPR